MLVQGMNYLLDIKQDLLITSNDWAIASNQQSAISNQQSALDFPLSIPLTFYGVSFLYPGTCLISLLGFYPMLRVRAFTPILCQSIAADCLLFSLNDSFLLCKEHL
jgi:hypothetical protein